MIEAMERVSERTVKFQCDHAVYSNDVIAKVLYWLTQDFRIYRRMISPELQEIVLEKKDGGLDEEEFESLRDRLNQELIDYNLREIIRKETKEIRTILYVKAFSPYDAGDLTEPEV